MTLRTRRCLFYSFFLIFIAFGAGAIFYSSGWRIVFDCEATELKNCMVGFQKTGAIFIETIPKDVEIKINNKIFKDKSGLLQSGTLIPDLIPKNYKVEIKKPGYLLWQKNVSVKSGIVVETGKIILVPEKINLQAVIISKDVSTFWENGQNFIFLNSGALYFNQEEPVKLKGDNFIAWSEDGNKFITEDLKNIYYLYNKNDLSKAVNLNLALANLKSGATISEIAFHPADSNKLIIRGKTGLYVLDLARSNLETVATKAISSFIIKNPNIIYISGSEIYSYGLLLKNNNLKFILAEELKDQKISALYSNGNAIFVLLRNGNLYIFNQQNPEGAAIANSVKKAAISPDNKKLAFWDTNGLNIYFIEDYKTEIVKKAGDIADLKTYNSSEIQSAFWHANSRHLFIKTSNNTAEFIEIDDRQPTNKYVLAENALNSYYDSNLNRFYFTQENKIYFTEI